VSIFFGRLWIGRWVVMDGLDSAVNFEEVHLKGGYDEGYSHGFVAGKDEGKQVGLKIGFEVGKELGFYSGCIHIWTSAIQIDPRCFSSRAKTAIAQMKDLIQKYPLMDPEDLQVQEIMDSLRLKFKMICSSLHVKLHYNGYPAEANDTQFWTPLLVISAVLIIKKKWMVWICTRPPVKTSHERIHAW